MRVHHQFLVYGSLDLFEKESPIIVSSNDERDPIMSLGLTQGTRLSVMVCDQRLGAQTLGAWTQRLDHVGFRTKELHADELSVKLSDRPFDWVVGPRYVMDKEHAGGGLLVKEVSLGSELAELGVAAGMTLLSVGGQDVRQRSLKRIEAQEAPGLQNDSSRRLKKVSRSLSERGF